MESNKKMMTALLLCVLGGTGGLHRFYVGKWRSGLLYLATCGIFGIGWITDLIMMFRGEFTDKYGFNLKA